MKHRKARHSYCDGHDDACAIDPKLATKIPAINAIMTPNAKSPAERF